MNTHTLTILGLVIVMSVGCLCACSGADFPKWPVRNGDFVYSQGWGFPTDWSPATNSGKLNFTMDPLGQNLGTAISTAMIETVEAGSGYYYQYLFLLGGKHRLSCEVSGTDGAQAQITLTSGSDRFGSELATVGSEWKLLQTDIQVQTGDASVSIMSQATAGQKVKFRNVRIDAVSLDSSVVPVAGGASIGGIVLPADPTPAEQYAAYELQKYIAKMTGHIPGLKGRDKTFAGAMVYIGRAATGQKTKLSKLQEDSYVLYWQGNRIDLAGKADQGTLYAVYDFLKQQGCRWVVPGSIGEIVPARKTLAKLKSKLESPDYECRGIMQMAQDFNPGGGEEFGWIAINIEDYFDWFLRNRMNAFWLGSTESYDFGAHRGHGWVQMLNHSYGSTVAPNEKYFKDHPDWYPLINGKREPMCKIPPGFCNQLCISNKGLRDYTVDLILDHFKNNPNSRAFPLSPMDGPSLWCECDECKKLDPPGIDWSKHATEGAVEGMTDRALNYANEVAERVSKVYPDKYIEMYAYGYTLSPPKREKVHKNVFIKYANLGNRGSGPLGLSLMEPDETGSRAAPKRYRWADWREQLEGWKKAGATMAYYNYLEFVHPDLTLFWFYSNSDVLRNLNRHYNCRILMGENENNVMISTVLYNIIFQTVWDVDTDYKAVMKDTCDAYYGPVAKEMLAYNKMMDEAIISSTAYTAEDYRPWDHVDIPLATLEKGRAMLEAAAEKVKDDKNLAKRIAYAQVGHGYLTYVAALYVKDKNPATRDIAKTAFDLANSTRLQHYIRVKYPSVQQLKTFYYPPVIEEKSILLQLPDQWQFKTDPDNKGLTEKWFEGQPDASWKPINITKDWTAQEAGAGYHGAAWYSIDFSLPADKIDGSKLAIQFGAVDGYVDVFLDGVKIGEQKADVGVMWDKAFNIPLPANLVTSASHRLVVRVSKDNFAAGIWQPVKIVKSE